MSPAPLQPLFILLTQWLSCSTVTFDSVHMGSSPWCAGKRILLKGKGKKKKLLFAFSFAISTMADFSDVNRFAIFPTIEQTCEPAPARCSAPTSNLRGLLCGVGAGRAVGGAEGWPGGSQKAC